MALNIKLFLIVILFPYKEVLAYQKQKLPLNNRRFMITNLDSVIDIASKLTLFTLTLN